MIEVEPGRRAEEPAEGFGLTVAEAMWKEQPVVASAVGNVDQIEDGTHGLLVDDPADLQAFGAALGAVLALTAAAQVAIFLLSNSVALLADLIHNFGDAVTALPLGIAFYLRAPSEARNSQASPPCSRSAS